MPKTMVATELGDALRRLAEVVDAAPALLGAALYPIPHALSVIVRTADVVHVLARDLGAEVTVYETDDGHVHTWFEVVTFPAALRVSHLGPAPRELHRPADVTDSIEAVDL